MTTDAERPDYVGEFRYVFYTAFDKYEPTISFYRDVLELPITGGFSHGTYFQASTGVIEVIQATGPHDLRDMLLAPNQRYQPPKGGFLLIEDRDLQALRRRVEQADATVVQDIPDWPWLFRDFKVVDPCGNVLCFFSRLPGWEVHHPAT